MIFKKKKYVKDQYFLNKMCKYYFSSTKNVMTVLLMNVLPKGARSTLTSFMTSTRIISNT